eukprot:4666628-Alexandrium_andersonii.AAC.1
MQSLLANTGLIVHLAKVSPGLVFLTLQLSGCLLRLVEKNPSKPINRSSFPAAVWAKYMANAIQTLLYHARAILRKVQAGECDGNSGTKALMKQFVTELQGKVDLDKKA